MKWHHIFTGRKDVHFYSLSPLYSSIFFLIGGYRHLSPCAEDSRWIPLQMSDIWLKQNSSKFITYSRWYGFNLSANGRNNSQHCWANNDKSCCARVGSGVPTDTTTPNLTMLGPAVQSWKDTTHKTFETMCNAHAWPQQCWKSCANGSNIVALCFGDSRNKRMLGVVGPKVWPVSNFARQHETTSNRVFKRTGQCWELLASNIASVCTGLYRLIFRSGHLKCIVLNLVKRDIQRKKHVASLT